MNSNYQKSSDQMINPSKITSLTNVQIESISNSNVNSRSQFPILKTEEKKEIVRTNIYEPNDNSLGNKPQFCVVTEVIRRSPNISLCPQRNSFNISPKNFSFNQIIPEQQMNQSFQNNAINVQISDSNSKNYEKGKNSNNYKLLIKRIATQLKKKVRQPTQGFFYFIFQKGEYPMNIIRKIRVQIINHTIKLDNAIFELYTQKYIKYRELIKKIAFLSKKSMKSIKFWENPRYSNNSNQIKSKNLNQTINVKLSQNTLNNKNNTTETSNLNHNNKKLNNKSKEEAKNIHLKSNAQNKKNNNQKNMRSNSNDSHTNLKTHINSKSNVKNQQKSNPKTNPFKANSTNNNLMNQKIKPIMSNKDNKKNNIKIPSLNKSLLYNKEKNKKVNIHNNTFSNQYSKTQNIALNLEVDKNKTLINVSDNRINAIDKEKKLPNIESQISDKNKMDIIKEDSNSLENEIKLGQNLNNNISHNIQIQDDLNIINTQSEPILYNYTETEKEIEMKNNFEKVNSNTIQYKIDNKTSDLNKFEIKNNKINFNNEFFNNNKNITMNEKERNNNFELNNRPEEMKNNKYIDMKNIQGNSDIPPNQLNKNVIDSSLFKDKDIKRVSFNSRKSEGKTIEIKLSAFRKNKKEEKNVNTLKNQSKNNIDNIQKVVPIVTTNLEDKSQTNLIQNNNNSLQLQISSINEFNLLLSNNNINIIFNIPTSTDEKGQNLLKQNIFWERYIQYLYNCYIVNKNKVSLFCFIQIIEQYFIWCENKSAEINLEFKKNIIDIVKKLYTDEEISQFLNMNKMNNLEELFKKYEIFMNKNRDYDFKSSKEIEVKIDNDSKQCNCELCKNEIACINRVSEINKNLLSNVNTDNILFSGNSNSNIKKLEKIEQRQNNINNVFTKSKTLQTFECAYNYIPKPKNEGKKESKKEMKSSSSKEKEISKKGSNKSLQKNKNKKTEKFVDLALEDKKIDEYLEKDKEEEKKEEIIHISDEEEKGENRNIKQKSKKIDKKKKKESKKYEEENKSDSENEEEKIKTKKKRKSKPRKKSKKENSDSEDDGHNSSNEKNTEIQYPKKSRKNRKKN